MSLGFFVGGAAIGLLAGYLVWDTEPVDAPATAETTPVDPVADLLAQAVELDAVGDTAGAEAIYEQILMEYPNNDLALYNMGVLRHFAGLVDEAADFYRRAIAANPQQVSAMYNLALLLRDEGDVDGSREAFEQILELRPDDANVLFQLGTMLVEDGQVADGQDYIDLAREIDPDVGRG